MRRRLLLTSESTAQLQELADNPAQAGLYKQVRKTLGLLELDPRHPGLKTHQYHSRRGKKGEPIWEAYVQNNTSGAYRLFFHYGPDEVIEEKRIPTITVVAITPHP